MTPLPCPETKATSKARPLHFRCDRQGRSRSGQCWRVFSPVVVKVLSIDRGNGIDTLPADADDVPGECSIDQQFNNLALRHVLREARRTEATERFRRDDDGGFDSGGR